MRDGKVRMAECKGKRMFEESFGSQGLDVVRCMSNAGRIIESITKARNEGETEDRVYAALLSGLRRQARKDGRQARGGPGSVCAVDESESDGCEERVWDDISGKELGQDGVREARKEELEAFRKHGYVKVPRAEC